MERSWLGTTSAKMGEVQAEPAQLQESDGGAGEQVTRSVFSG